MLNNNEAICLASEILENAGDYLENNPDNARILQVLKWRINNLVPDTTDKRIIFLSQFFDGYIDDIWRNMAIELTYESGGQGEEILRETIEQIGKKLKRISIYLFEDETLKYYETFSDMSKLYIEKLRELERKRYGVKISYSIGKIKNPENLSGEKKIISETLDNAKAVIKCEHTLSGGMLSNYFLNVDKIIAKPEYLEKISTAYISKLNEISVDISYLAFIEKDSGPTGSLILLHSIMNKTKKPSFIVDLKKRTDIGRIKGIDPKTGENVAIISDTATTGDTIMNVANFLRKKGLITPYAVVLFDREIGAQERLKEYGIELIPLLTENDLEKSGMIEPIEKRIVDLREKTTIPPSKYKIDKFQDLIGAEIYQQIKDVTIF